MLKKLIYRLLEKRHYWRYVDFSELAELYASRMLRLTAVSMVSVLVVIYLYQQGYSFVFIMLYCSAYLLIRGLLSMPAAWLVARIGPKHGTLVSNLLYVPGLALLAGLPQYGVPALLIFGLLQAASVTLYDIAYFVDFSKVKHDDHVGKELGFMNIVDRASTSLSPLIGGVIAFWFGPQATMWAAAALFAVAAAPLLFTPEPTKTHQKLLFRYYNWRDTWKGMMAQFAVGIDFGASASLWSLYVAIAIFGTASNLVYAQIGALASVTIIASLVFSRMFGALIDRKKGGQLLKYSVWSNAILHVLRPFVGTPAGVGLVNVANQAVTNGYNMPFVRGMFDVADNVPGYRIVYLSYMELFFALGSSVFFLVVGLLALYFPEVISMQVGFVLAGLGSLGVLGHSFPALRRSTL